MTLNTTSSVAELQEKMCWQSRLRMIREMPALLTLFKKRLIAKPVLLGKFSITTYADAPKFLLDWLTGIFWNNLSISLTMLWTLRVGLTPPLILPISQPEPTQKKSSLQLLLTTKGITALPETWSSSIKTPTLMIINPLTYLNMWWCSIREEATPLVGPTITLMFRSHSLLC